MQCIFCTRSGADTHVYGHMLLYIDSKVTSKVKLIKVASLRKAMAKLCGQSDMSAHLHSSL
jgi:hypothetical protein